jgi:hypothetical protein
MIINEASEDIEFECRLQGGNSELDRSTKVHQSFVSNEEVQIKQVFQSYSDTI